MHRYFVIVFVLFSLAGYLQAGEPRWLSKMREVKLLEHNYADVLKILGQPSDGTSEPAYLESFDAIEGRYYVQFETGRCVITDYSNGGPIGWKVPEFTALSISFRPKGKIKPTKLGFDLGSFRKYEISDIPGAYIFENNDLGIDLGIKRNGYLEEVGFQPPKSKRHLHC